MEVYVNSPGSQDEVEPVIMPGADVVTGSSPTHYIDPTDEPVTGLQSPFSPGDSPMYQSGPATPGGDLNEDQTAVEMQAAQNFDPSASRSPNMDVDDSRLRSPSSQDENEKNQLYAPDSPVSSQEDHAPTPGSPPSSQENGNGDIRSPGSPSSQDAGGIDSRDQALTPGSPANQESESNDFDQPVRTPGSPANQEEEITDFDQPARTPGSPINEEVSEAPADAPSSPIGQDFSQDKGDSSGSPSNQMEGEDPLKNETSLPQRGAFESDAIEHENQSSQFENDNTAISYAFLSDGLNEGSGISSQEVVIPFLGDSTIPEPSPEPMEEEEVAEEVVSTSMEEQVIEDGNIQEEIVETVQDTEEVATSALPENKIEENQKENDVVESAERKVTDKETEDTPAEVKEKGGEEPVAEPPHSPEQVVEEVFLSTEAKRNENKDDSDFDGFDADEAASPQPTRTKKKRRLISDDEDEDEQPTKTKPSKPAVQDDEESDFEGFEPEEEKKGDRQDLIADIFGQSDDEGEFEGFAEAEVQPVKEDEELQKKEEEESKEKSKEKKKDGSSSSSSEDEGVGTSGMPSFTSDFEEMMARKKEETRKRRRRRGDIDIINNSDDLVVNLISDMKICAKMDRDLILMRQPAIQKLRMLPQVESMLRKADMQLALIDCGVLSAITEWLSPLPDRSLPALSIRTNLLQALGLLPGIGAENLKESGVGKAVMYLHKHPKETSENRRIAGKLVYSWSRPIFDLTSDYKSLSKEARQKRDMDNLPKKRRISADADAAPKRDIDKEMNADNKSLRPGDPGWVARARVPQPSNKDYVYRPKSKLENAVTGSAPKKPTKFERHLRALKDSKAKGGKLQKAVSMSLEGRKMAL